MRKLRYSESAERDTLNILEYISLQSSSTTAERFVLELRRRCRDLASLPGLMGRARPDLGPNVRSRAHGNYVIYLQYSGTTLRILRIMEGHRDIATEHFQDDEM